MTSSSDPLILGIGASHNGSVCVLRGSEIVVAIQEERLTRIKRDRIRGGQPCLAIDYCLDAAGITAGDLDLVVCSSQSHSRLVEEDITLNSQLRLIRRDIPWMVVSHHLAHAVSSYSTSGFDDAAALVVDGLGSPLADLAEVERAVVMGRAGRTAWESISLYDISHAGARPLEKQMAVLEDGTAGPLGSRLSLPDWDLPNSGTLGRLYAAVTNQIFGRPTDAGKVMALAALGTQTIQPEDFYQVNDGRFTFLDRVPRRFPERRAWPAFEREYADLACSVQIALEEALLLLARRLRDRTESRNLCFSGGVALNSVANERLIRESGFERVHIVPAAEDCGIAIGAAYLGLASLRGRLEGRALTDDGMGRAYSRSEIDAGIASVPRTVRSDPDDVLGATVERLVAGQICGWFQGGSELGPRALGHRSIICDPRRPDAKAVLNARVKRREMFRPFAPVVPLAEAHEWFDAGDSTYEAPFMLRVLPFRPDKLALVPAVVHEDGTGRVQTLTPDSGRLYDLLMRFKSSTGVPILLNTSFNVADEPIVETPADALWSLLEVDLDFCVLGDTLVTRAEGYRSLLELVPAMPDHQYRVFRRCADGRLASHRPGGELVEFDVSTPWGPQVRTVTPPQLAVLNHVDGQRTGWEVLEVINAQPASNMSDAWLLKTLALLRRLGIISLSESR